ncbi:MAG: hypothetical protein AAFZ67_04690 [Planctomycetota bacterium]
MKKHTSSMALTRYCAARVFAVKGDAARGVSSMSLCKVDKRSLIAQGLVHRAGDVRSRHG